jgi:hypothetical protein
MALAATMALRQLHVFGVNSRELETLRHRVQDVVRSSEELLKSISHSEVNTLRTIPEEDGEDREQAEFVVMLSVYAEYGIRIACKIQRQRLAEAN